MPVDQFADFMRGIAVAIIPVLFGITLHEVGHGLMARHFGDRTAEMLGRLSLNPLKHVDPLGTIVVPILMLLLGGFVIAVAMSKYRLDEYIAYNVIERAGNNSKIIILSLISTSAFISMWISNSATAAIIMPIALVILAKNRIKPGTSKSATLCNQTE